jgi:hypothetical protein
LVGSRWVARKFTAAASGKFYNISASGPAGAPFASGFSSDACQWTPFLSRLFFVNGADTAQICKARAMALLDVEVVTTRRAPANVTSI